MLELLDPDRVSGQDASSLYRALARIEHLAVAGKALLSPRIETTGVWKEGGHRDAATFLAELEGVSPGQAKRTLEVGQRLSSLPGTEAAVRQGELSGPKLIALTQAGAVDPTRESELLDGAADEPLARTTERCRQVRITAASADPEATYRAIFDRRSFRSWTDPEGAFCYEGRDTPDRGAKLLAHLGSAAAALRRSRKQAGLPSEADSALRADALYLLVTTQAGTRTDAPAEDGPGEAEDRPGGDPTRDHLPGVENRSEATDPLPRDLLALAKRPPPASVVVRVDLAALLRGRAKPTERCELDGVGPIPASLAQVLTNDAYLALCYHKAGDIKAIAHLGRTIRAPIRTALIERDRTCVVPGCGMTKGLEIDHVLPLAQGGPTALENLALLCYHHHHLKTYGGWDLTHVGTDDSGRPIWSFTPEPPFGQEPGLGIDTPEGKADWLRLRRELK